MKLQTIQRQVEVVLEDGTRMDGSLFFSTAPAVKPDDVDFDNMPTGLGGTVPDPPQPGIYLFRLPPSDILFNLAFDKVTDPEQGERIALILKDAAALYNESLKEPYGTRLTNIVRYIQRGDKQIAISDIAMLLKAVGCIPDSNSSNAAYAQAIVSAGGRTFMAESTLTATCNPSRDVYAYNEATGRSETHAGVKGCGQKYRVEGYTPKGGGRPVLAIPRGEDGKVSTRFTCTCGAELRAWPQLQGFKPAP